LKKTFSTKDAQAQNSENEQPKKWKNMVFGFYI
jgi:hypothetical protein